MKKYCLLLVMLMIGLLKTACATGFVEKTIVGSFPLEKGVNFFGSTENDYFMDTSDIKGPPLKLERLIILKKPEQKGLEDLALSFLGTKSIELTGGIPVQTKEVELVFKEKNCGVKGDFGGKNFELEDGALVAYNAGFKIEADDISIKRTELCSGYGFPVFNYIKAKKDECAMTFESHGRSICLSFQPEKKIYIEELNMSPEFCSFSAVGSGFVSVKFENKTPKKKEDHKEDDY